MLKNTLLVGFSLLISVPLKGHLDTDPHSDQSCPAPTANDSLAFDTPLIGTDPSLPMASGSTDPFSQGEPSFEPFGIGIPYPQPTTVENTLPDDILVGNWIIGNGGDNLSLAFAKARNHAATIVEQLRAENMGPRFDPALKQFLLKYRDHLAWDIRHSEHQWNLADTEGKPTCAWTLTPDPELDIIPTAHIIQLSYPTCRKNIKSFADASALLIHESCHHFGISSEEVCNHMAISIMEAWRNGGLDWIEVSPVNAPLARERHSAVWTGEEMLVFGGYNSEINENLNSLHSFNPTSGTWKERASPIGLYRHSHHAVSTPKGVLIWGGYEGPIGYQSWQYDGALYNPTKDAWSYFRTPWEWGEIANNSFFDGARQTATWTGSELLVWGGSTKNGVPLGGSFDPVQNHWEPLSLAGTPPQRMAGHSAVWTGSKLIVWGGYMGTASGNRHITNEGALYDGEQWIPMTLEGAPSPRAGHAAVWTGNSMVVFSGGGIGSRGMLNATGGIYFPGTDETPEHWLPLATEIAIERMGHKAIWTSQEVLITGGRSNRLATWFKDVVALDTTSLRATGVSAHSAPEPRWFHTAVWTGDSMIVWGGSNRGMTLNSGGIFFP